MSLSTLQPSTPPSLPALLASLQSDAAPLRRRLETVLAQTDPVDARQELRLLVLNEAPGVVHRFGRLLFQVPAILGQEFARFLARLRGKQECHPGAGKHAGGFMIG
jgi:hypothetical protein